GGAAFALEEAARNAPGGREFLLIVDGQREEVLPFLDALRGSDRAEDDGFAIGREHRAVGLAGNAARFESERLAAPLDFNFSHVKHLISLNSRGRMRRGPLCGPLCPRRSGPLWSVSAARRIAGAGCAKRPGWAASMSYLRRPSFAIRAV